MLETLDAAAVRDWCTRALTLLSAHQAEIDALNVYPVPDGDTGSNLVQTLRSAADEVARADGDALAATMRALAHGALTGARGNSGVILSQLLRGFGEVLGPLPSARGREVAEGLVRAADSAYRAVARPVEGTMLSVARAAADAARGAGDGATLPAVVAAARAGAWAALRRTPDQLSVLAGAVDAGGQGLCLVFDALDAVVDGRPAPAGSGGLARGGGGPDGASAEDGARAGRAPGGDGTAAGDVPHPADGGAGENGYEVQYLLTADDGAVDGVREALDPLGDSLVVTGGDGLWAVHVHVPVAGIGPALEAGIAAGRPSRITVTRFAGGPDRPRPAPAGERVVVGVVTGPGLADVLAAEGVRIALAAGGVEAVLAAADTAAEVVLVPEDRTLHELTRRAARLASGAGGGGTAGRTVAVVPARAAVEALAAVAVHDPAASFTEDVATMVATAAAVRVATLDRTEGGLVGTVLGGAGQPDEAAAGGTEAHHVAADLLAYLLADGGELVTLVTGAGAPAGLADWLSARLGATHPDVEVTAYPGGAPGPLLVVGIE